MEPKKANTPGEQIDIGGPKPASNVTDAAIAAVRGYQSTSGNVTTIELSTALKGLNDDQLLYVSIATRVPVSQLKALQRLS